MSDKLCFNIGAGEKPLPGFISLDRKTGDEAFPLTYRGMRVADNSVDELYASHVLEHFSHRQTADVLAEWTRVLKPGGRIRISVPSLDWWVDTYLSDDSSRYPMEQLMLGGHMDANDHHGSLFPETKLRQLMHGAGLARIKPWQSDANDCAAMPLSLNLMGFKRRGLKVQGVTGILSIPRLLFADQIIAVMDTMNKLGLPMRLRQGVFWDQTLTMSIEAAMALDKPKYLLTVDYDSLFTPEDVEDLYELMETRPEIDALCAMQMGRERDRLLMTSNAGAKNARLLMAEMQNDTLPIGTGHFGLTMIRAESIAKLPKPWFWHQPDPDGSWGPKRMDSDVYFWRGWEKAGLTACQANHVVIGHLQLLATWPGKDLKPVHQYLPDYRRNGKTFEAFP